MGYQLGVDLGTTFTAAAIARGGRAEAVTLGTNSSAVPSVVYLGDGGLVVGQVAQRRATTDPSRVAREFKRRLGDPTPILLGGSPVAAELLMARFLDWVVGEVAGLEGGPPEALAVTHPANWGPYKLDLFSQAIRHVGLRADRLVPEPVAAATFYASQRTLAPGSLIAVYDLGGGTFDATLVRSESHGFAIVGEPDGVERLGGIDFDHAVLRYVTEAVGVDLDAVDPDDPGMTAALTQLREHCITAKEALSAETATAIPVALPGLYVEVRLTRGELEAMIRPALDETIVALVRTIAAARVSPTDVTAVLLVGGSSRIPLIGQLVAAKLGRPIAVDARPKDAVAFGAALAAAALPVAAEAIAAPPSPVVVGDGPAGGTAVAPADLRPGTDPSTHAGRASATIAPAPPAAAAAPPATAGEPSSPEPAAPRPRRLPRRLGVAVLISSVATVGALAWRTATDGAGPPAVVAAGVTHTCALRDGTVDCWGADDEGQATPPEGVELTAIAAGRWHTCGIRTDVTVTCWGADGEQQSSPQPDERFTSITAGDEHSCGIHPDGTVDCWGDGSYGQRTPQEDRTYTRVSAGRRHTCGIRTDRTVTCWGNDIRGISSAPNGEFVALDAGQNHTCGVRSDQSVECWGQRDEGGTAPPDGERFLDVSAGTGFTCGIRTDLSVACWGNDLYSQATPPDGRFTSLSAGEVHTCGVRLNNSVECWGGDLSGPAAVPD